MAKIDLKFIDSTETKDWIKVEMEESDTKCFIDIYSCEDGVVNLTRLDKSTAIKFAKTLRTEINKIEEGSNG